MIRRIAIVAIVVGAGVLAAPGSASADRFCESVGYNGVTTVTQGPICEPYSGPTECTAGYTGLSVLGTVWHDLCLPVA
ncbi:MAG: hypothetical protein QOC82_3104 [Frankiaceae bacterium]|jgi:hypothetical protein|nr:hypothetical protein [Frankiaceae bacterium]